MLVGSPACHSASLPSLSTCALCYPEWQAERRRHIYALSVSRRSTSTYTAPRSPTRSRRSQGRRLSPALETLRPHEALDFGLPLSDYLAEPRPEPKLSVPERVPMSLHVYVD